MSGWTRMFMLTAGLTVMVGAPLPGQSRASVFERLEGPWVGQGQLMGRSATFEMRWERHGDGLAVIFFANGFLDAGGRRTPVLQAGGVYEAKVDGNRGVWLDTRGERVDITWQADDSTLSSNWSSAREEGKTVYRVLSSTEAHVVDSVRGANGWREFGQARYTRLSGDARAFDEALRPVAWLAGCWRLQRGDLVIDEQWMRPVGPVMLGMNRTMRGSRLADSEFLKLQVIDGVVYYIAIPSGQSETHFRLSEASDSLVTFSAPEHDFPQHVSYRRIGSDSLVASIFGEARGQQRRVDFPKRRVACGSQH